MPWGSFVRPRPWAHEAYRASELAEAFGISRRAVYHLAKRGVLKYTRLSPRMMLFSKSSVRAMLKAGFALSLKE